MGRPTVLDDLVARRLVEAYRKGLPRETSAKLAGIAETALYEWMRKGTRDVALGVDSPYARLAHRLDAAEAEGDAELLQRIREASVKSWQAAAWILSKRRPQYYAPIADDGKINLLEDEEPMGSEELEQQLTSALAAVRTA